jgi:1-acyl-sn-glycerol-3-phosphate acyltransferase
VTPVFIPRDMSRDQSSPSGVSARKREVSNPRFSPVVVISRFIEWLMIVSVRLLAGAQARWPDGAPASDQCIYVANHSSHLDALLLFSTLPAHLRRQTRPVAAADYWTAGPLRRYLVHFVFRGVLVEREARPLKPLESMADALSGGHSLILFPEGTRGPGQTLQPLKTGIFHLARRFPDVSIVPAWIDNSYRILPKGLAIPVPLLCSITFGKPLRWKEGQQQNEFLAEVRQSLETLRH